MSATPKGSRSLGGLDLGKGVQCVCGEFFRTLNDLENKPHKAGCRPWHIGESGMVVYDG